MGWTTSSRSGPTSGTNRAVLMPTLNVEKENTAWMENVLVTSQKNQKLTPDNACLHSLRRNSSLKESTEQNTTGTSSVNAVLMVTKFASKMRQYASLELTAHKTWLCAQLTHKETSSPALSD